MTSRDIRRLPSRARVSTDVRRTQSRRFIHTFVLPSGERLPLLVDRMTGAVCQLAARWATLERRDRVAASTILADQRALRYLYDWADTGLPCPLDAYFIDGRELTRPSIWGLSTYIKTGGQRVTAAAPRHPAEVNGSSGASAVRVVQSPPVFNNHWSKLALFIYWVTGMYARAGAEAHVPEATIDEARARMKALFAEQFVGERVESPVRVLDDEEIVALRRAIALDRRDVWPDPGVRERNALMIYVALNTGVRTGELLTLTLNQIPRGRQDYIVVRRHPDDRADPRLEAPQVKTHERELYIPEWLRTWLARYVTEVRPHSRSPFLFLTQGGRPLSPRRARSVMGELSRFTGIALAWHDLRHTFLDDYYTAVAPMGNGLDLLMDVAGWSSIQSADPYVRLARKRRADGALRAYHRRLFTPDPIGDDDGAGVA